MLNFTGTTRRRNVNLGGRSLVNKNKNSVLQNAQAERAKREKQRKELKATILIQAYTRRLLTFKHIERQLSDDWPNKLDNPEQLIRKFCFFFNTSNQSIETSLHQLSQLEDVLNQSTLIDFPQILKQKLVSCLIECIVNNTNTPEISSAAFKIFKQIFNSDINVDKLNIDLDSLSSSLIKLRSHLLLFDVLYFLEKTPKVFMKQLMFNKEIINFQLDSIRQDKEADKLLGQIVKSCLYLVLENAPELRDSSDVEKFNLFDSILYLIISNFTTFTSVDDIFISACTAILESIKSGLKFTMDIETGLDDEERMDIDDSKSNEIVVTEESYQRLLKIYSMDSLKMIASKFLNDNKLFHVGLNYFHALTHILTPIDATCLTNENLKSSLVAKLIVLSSDYNIVHRLYEKINKSSFVDEITYLLDRKEITDISNNKLWDLVFSKTDSAWWQSFDLFQELYSYLLYVSNDKDLYKKGKLSKSEFLSFTLFLKNFSIFVVIAGRKLNSVISKQDEEVFYLLKRFPNVGRFSIRLLKQIYLRNLKFGLIKDDFWLLKSIKFDSKLISSILAGFPNDDEDVSYNTSFFDLFSNTFVGDSGPVRSVTEQQTNTALILIHLPFMIPFELRAEVFHSLIRIDKLNLPYHHHFDGLKGSVSRDNLLNDAFEEFSTASGRDFKGPLSISFTNKFGAEAGIDGGGLTKELLTGAVAQGFSVSINKEGPVNIASQLFQATNVTYQLYPNPHIFWNHRFQQYLNKEFNNSIVVFPQEDEAHNLEMLKFLGMIVGKCLYDNILIDVSFAPFFLSKWSGGIGSISDRFAKGQKPQQYRNSLHDLKDFDTELYQNLNKLLEMSDADLKNLDLTFTLNEKIIDYDHSEVFDSVVKLRGSDIFTIDLIPNGSNISVDASNRLQYIYSVAKFKLDHSISIQSNYFLEGLFKIISPNWLSLFNPVEIQLLVSGGEKEIDIDDLKTHIEISGFPSDSTTIHYLFDILKNDFSPEEKSKFVKFVTSSSKAPLLGFKELNPLFGIRSSGNLNLSRLPTASTCMNLLKLPDYCDRDLLKAKLLYAIKSEAGFDLS